MRTRRKEGLCGSSGKKELSNQPKKDSKQNITFIVFISKAVKFRRIKIVALEKKTGNFQNIT